MQKERGKELEDSKIIDLLFARSEQALTELAEKYERLIARIAGNLLSNKEDVAECINDTYLGIWNSIPPNHPDPLLAYVCRVARNISIRKYRDQRAQKRNSEFDISMEELGDCIGDTAVEESVEAQELGRAIDRFLGTLDRDSRVLFVRRYWFSDSAEVLAKRFHISENLVAVRLGRIRKKLKAYLEREGYWVS